MYTSRAIPEHHPAVHYDSIALINDNMASPSGFLARLKPEIRLFIYEHVFGDSEVITQVKHQSCRPTPPTELHAADAAGPSTSKEVHTSILTANKLIFPEAIDVLYDKKIVRGTVAELLHLLSTNKDFGALVRHVEVADCIHGYKNASFYTLLENLPNLPRTPSCTILSDCLGWLEDGYLTEYKDRFVSVQEFTRMAELGKPTCVAVGRYQLDNKFAKVQIENRRLLKMLPDVENTPADYDAYADWITFIGGRGQYVGLRNMKTFAAQHRFRCYIGMREVMFECFVRNGSVVEIACQLRTRRRCLITWKS